MKDTAYAFSVAKIRAIENALMTSADMEQLISAKHTDDCMRMLTDRGYGNGEMQTRVSFNTLFRQEREKLWRNIKEIAPNPEIFDIFLYKNDYHNLKVILKGLTKGEKYENMLMSPFTINPELIEKAVTDGNFSILPTDFAKTAEKAYIQLTRENNSQGASVTADKASVEALCRGAEKTDNEFFKEIANLTADCINMKTALRCAMIGKDMNFAGNALAEAGSFDIKALAVAAGTDVASVKEFAMGTFLAEAVSDAEKDFSAFEKECDDIIMRHIMKAKYKSFGPEPILAYIYAKETELKALHIIMTGKTNKTDDEAIRGRLKLLYV